MAVAKHCVFCGLEPQDKSKEHVVPRWLIELTGDPSRAANFGLNKDAETRTLSVRTFAFDKFTFPACSFCNQKFSGLEANVKKTMTAVMSGEPVPALALSEMLDWFDKVRVGLWLGMRLLDKNFVGVQPNFHIESRLGQHDRMLIVEKSDFQGQRLNFVAVDTPSFALTPSAFVLIVNNYHFTNISSMFLCAGRLGFPYAAQARVHPDRDETEIDLTEGRHRLMRPVLRRAIAEKGKRIYQPMFKSGLRSGATEIYDCAYVRQHSIEYSEGVGNIFVESDSGVTEFGRMDQVKLDPALIQPVARLDVLSGINVLEWQLWLHENLPSMELLSTNQRRYIRRRFGGADRVNKALLNHYRKLL